MLKRIGYYFLNRGFRLPDQISRYQELSALSDILKTLTVDCVIDVGANIGQFGQDLRSLGYGGKIVSFEPSPDAFAVLKTKLDENWLAFQLGLGSSEGILELNIDPNSVMNSFLKPKNPHATKKISVKVVRLDSMVDEILRLTKANSLFLKCDTQGFDTEVVTGAGHFAESLKGLMSEVSVQPLYENMTDYTDAIISYQKMGFKLHSLHPVTIDKQGCIVEYNCMMTRPN